MMNINLDGSLISLITAGLAFIASLIAAGVSIYNARFRRFVSEKWWHRKSDAYIKIIDELANSIAYLEDLYEGVPAKTIQEIEQEKKQEYKSYLGARTLKVDGLFINERASNELVKLDKALDDIFYDGYYEGQAEYVQIGAQLAARRSTLKVITTIVKKDLRVG